MATLFPIPQYFDNNGDPLAAGLIYTYAAGTTTNKTAYKNQAQSATHTNPIVLDADGRPPANGIWLNGSYKLVIKSADASVTYHTLDTLNEYNPYDWTGLTATISDINGYAAASGVAGTVGASKTVVVDSSKNIGTFGTLTAVNLVATTGTTTPLIKDANGVAAITIASTASQVNAVTLTPSATGNAVQIAATGADSNINLNLKSKGTGLIKFNDFSLPATDGSSGQYITTNGSKVLSFSTLAGVKQVVSSFLHTLQTITTVLPYDNTIPQNTEGDQVLSLAITPTSATSTLIIDINVTAASNSTSRTVGMALFQDSTANALAATEDTNSCNLRHVMTSGTTSATTFNVRVGPSAAGSVYINGTTGGVQLYNGVCNSSIVIWEII